MATKTRKAPKTVATTCVNEGGVVHVRQMPVREETPVFTVPPAAELDTYNSNAVRALYLESGLRVPLGAGVSTLRGILARLRDGLPLGYGLVAPK